jgi:phage baseplate assembly protein W
MAWDASRQNEKRSSRVYKDLNLNFTANPVTGDVTTVTDVIAVKRSVRNLLLTNHYDKPFHPEIGSNVPALLFESFGPITGNQLSRAIEEMIGNFEPRARVTHVECSPISESNSYNIVINFYVENLPAELQTFQTLLEAVR